MVEQTPIEKDEVKPEPKPEEAPAPVGTSIKGDGPPDGFGLGGPGGSGGNGLGGKGSGRAGSRFGWYGGQVQSKIAEAIRGNKKTRSASIASLTIRVWADASTGRVTRAQLAGTTGDKNVDEALQSEVLNGLQLQEPPPAGMPMPIVMRVNARRPN